VEGVDPVPTVTSVNRCYYDAVSLLYHCLMSSATCVASHALELPISDHVYVILLVSRTWL
jgi:hypothetical protein